MGDWLQLVGVFDSPMTIAASWFMMTCAMMLPLVPVPLNHVRQASAPSRRGWAIFLWLAGYFAVWMVASLVLLPFALLLPVLLPAHVALPLLVVAGLIWSASPICQRARNACHRIDRIGAPGVQADWDCFRFGLRIGLVCLAICWPWMIVPMLADPWHATAMLAASAWVFLDRIFPARRPSWRLPPAIEELFWRANWVLERSQRIHPPYANFSDNIGARLQKATAPPS
jgi:predicted metal-binding membrane protein